MDTLAYWLSRLEPLIRAEAEGEIIVIFANRCGIEDEVVYAGTSAVIGINEGEVNVYGLLGRGEKELLVVDTEEGPTAKLVSTSKSAATTDVPASTSESEAIEDRPDANPGWSESDGKLDSKLGTIDYEHDARTNGPHSASMVPGGQLSDLSPDSRSRNASPRPESSVW